MSKMKKRSPRSDGVIPALLGGDTPIGYSWTASTGVRGSGRFDGKNAGSPAGGSIGAAPHPSGPGGYIYRNCNVYQHIHSRPNGREKQQATHIHPTTLKNKVLQVLLDDHVLHGRHGNLE